MGLSTGHIPGFLELGIIALLITKMFYDLFFLECKFDHYFFKK